MVVGTAEEGDLVGSVMIKGGSEITGERVALGDFVACADGA